jgi:hypothetical protein
MLTIVGMEIEEAAIAVAAGKRAVVEDAAALSVIEANVGQPVPVALHRTGDWCTILFITKQSDGEWRTDTVPVCGGGVESYGGGTGGIVLRSQIERGKPFVEGSGQHFLGDQLVGLYEADGVSADDAVRMRWNGDVVAEAAVAAHGYFVLTAILPSDPEVTVEGA